MDNPVDVRELDAAELERVGSTDAYLAALLRDGPGLYVANAPVAVRALQVDSAVVPVVVAEPARDASEVCSVQSHYVGYTLAEMRKRFDARTLRWIRPIFRLFGAVLRACRIDRAVYVDNWLLSTNPVTPLSADQIARVGAFLRGRYPRHAIVFRSVNPALDAARHRHLREAGYRMVKARRVFVFDPRSDEVRQRNDFRIDRRLLERTTFDVARASPRQPPDPAALARLYRDLYIDRHCPLNPQYTERFFAVVLRDPMFSTYLFRRGGTLAGFGCVFVRGGHMTGAMIGYDDSVPRRLGLYRQLVMKMLVAADEAGLRLNLSAGVPEFKRLRGGIEHVEYDAVDDRHLPAWRRLAWRLVELEGALWRKG